MMQNKIDFTPKENKIIVAETRTLDKVLNVNALVSYDDSEELSFKIDNCTIKTVYVNENDNVEEGQLLAELDASDLEYQIAAKQVDLKRVQLKYDKLQSELDIEPTDRKIQMESLELDMESIKLDITHIKELISETQLIAPFSGVITDIISFQPGETVQAYEKFMTIWKQDSVILISDVLNPDDVSGSIDLSGIVTGMKVILIYGSMDKRTEIPATITRIINTDPGVLDNSNRIIANPPTFRVYVKPDGIFADKLYIDDTVIRSINTGKLENVVVLPTSSIGGLGIDHAVKVVKCEKIITRRITTGYEDNEEDIVVIISGLRPGESIIVNLVLESIVVD
jgi:multidrug efflux pump subunit AcrA (membrane-fusion protein)